MSDRQTHTIIGHQAPAGALLGVPARPAGRCREQPAADTGEATCSRLSAHALGDPMTLGNRQIQQSHRYYVYTLSDPRDGAVFYVGKGCGNRIDQHERDARKGRFANAGKELRIREIWAAGCDVVKVKVIESLTEPAAYLEEARLISEIGIENLTNIGCWHEPEEVKVMARASLFIERMTARLGSLSADRALFAGRLIDEMREAIDVCRRRLGIAHVD